MFIDRAKTRPKPDSLLNFPENRAHENMPPRLRLQILRRRCFDR